MTTNPTPRRVAFLALGILAGAAIAAGAAARIEDSVTALAPTHTLCRTDGIYHECNPPTTVAPFVTPTTATPTTTAAPVTTTSTTSTTTTTAPTDPAGCYDEPSDVEGGREVIGYPTDHPRTVEGVPVPCPVEWMTGTSEAATIMASGDAACVEYVGPVDEPDGAQFEAFSDAHGGALDYHGNGTWTDDVGRVVGYATAEDSTIWNTATCAATEGVNR